MKRREADILEIKELFYRCFGAGEDILKIYFAPGRINIIGEHIDYNGGFVMPCAINRGTYLAVAPNRKGMLRFFSCSHQESGVYQFPLKTSDGADPWEKTGHWADYTLGVLEMFRRRGLFVKGGYDFLYCGDLPEGAGFSSSASIEMATAMALKDLVLSEGGGEQGAEEAAGLDEKELALLCRQAENEFVGVQCGVMDQLAVALGKEDHALLLDTATLDCEYVPMALSNIRVVVVNSGVSRKLADGAYNEIRSKNETAARILGAEEGRLCRVSPEEAEAHREALEENGVFPLVRHMLNENARTLYLKKAIEDGDLRMLGQMLKESHESLKEDLEVSCYELDLLAETANEMDCVLGARMMGGGFGGCILALVEERSLRAFKRQITAEYTRKADMLPIFYDDLKISGGAEVIYEKTSAYPRPAMKRSSFIDLNGMWEYAITREADAPAQYQGQIRVPFSPEAPLSGVGRQVKPDEYLHYRLRHSLDATSAEKLKAGHRLMLHFGAVDQSCRVFVNGREAGGHRGGYLPFAMDITEYVKRDEARERDETWERDEALETVAEEEGAGIVDADMEIKVAVRDITDTGYETTGKQRLDQGGMFYTAQSGIWQSVWMEVVPEVHIAKVDIRPDIDESRIFITVAAAGLPDMAAGSQRSDEVSEEDAGAIRARIAISPQGEVLSGEAAHITADITPGRETVIGIPDPALWTPETPNLYDIRIELGTDAVHSYFAMRKVSMEKDEKGFLRFALNNRPYFVNGVLDQGYWREGLYTAPDEEALFEDIRRMKALGFNCLRKHVKIEPQIWYHHCDKTGMLVMQDMVNGGGRINSLLVTYLPNIIPNFTRTMRDDKYKALRRDSEGSQKQYLEEVREMIEALGSFPCIVSWVAFNEGWGQFDSRAVTEFIRALDGSRLIDSASGWFDRGCGDFDSIHNYFFDLDIEPKGDRIVALTEYGGAALLLKDHFYGRKKYGYGKCKSRDELTAKYREVFQNDVLANIPKGLSVSIYTQLSDIEDEINGIYTYDREVLKFDEAVLKELNGKVNALNERGLSVEESVPAGPEHPEGQELPAEQVPEGQALPTEQELPEEQRAPEEESASEEQALPAEQEPPAEQSAPEEESHSDVQHSPDEEGNS